jgi:hypothetical protein
VLLFRVIHCNNFTSRKYCRLLQPIDVVYLQSKYARQSEQQDKLLKMTASAAMSPAYFNTSQHQRSECPKENTPNQEGPNKDYPHRNMPATMCPQVPGRRKKEKSTAYYHIDAAASLHNTITPESVCSNPTGSAFP